MDIRAEEISKIIRDQIGSYAVEVDVAEVGTVISIGDGIAPKRPELSPVLTDELVPWKSIPGSA